MARSPRTGRKPVGAGVAELLRHSWRPLVAPDLKQSGEGEARLAAVVPPLLASGCGPLAWNVLRSTPAADFLAAQPLRQAYRLHALHGAVQEGELARVAATLAAAGVRPLLMKGWGIARYYAENHLRPYGDLDFLVAPEEEPAAREALARLAGLRCPVELHGRFNFPCDRSVRELGGRAHAASVAGTALWQPDPADHLRLLCLHLLSHGAWRPLWLSDVAALVEGEGSNLDWDRCLHGNPLYTGWVETTLLLARELLGMDGTLLPDRLRERELPTWLAPAVTRQWAVGTGSSTREGLRPGRLLRRPAQLVEELALRARNPIEATVEREQPFTAQFPFMAMVAATVTRSLSWMRAGASGFGG